MKYQNIFIDLDDTIWNFVNDFLSGLISRKVFWEYAYESKIALEIIYDRYGLSEYYPFLMNIIEYIARKYGVVVFVSP